MKKTVWALLDDRMGSIGQARGILGALDNSYDIIEKKIVYNRWAKLPNCLKWASRLGMDRRQSSHLAAPWPDLILSISRRTTPIARWIKKQSGGKSKIVQLMYPGNCGINDLDLIVVPEHDRKPGRKGNLFYITGCAHRVSEEAAAAAEKKWAPVFADLPKPWTTVIVGGAIKDAPFSEENAKNLTAAVRKIYQQCGGSILITTSRRTGAAAEQIIKQGLQDIPAYTYWWGEQKENPIMGFYACPERIIVTGDTVSMCSESCGSGKPVLIFCGKDWLRPKHLRFVCSLYDGGYACSVEAPEALNFKPRQRLNPARLIAVEIAKLF